MGCYNEDGEIYICDRIMNIIRINGLIVYPIEIENVLRNTIFGSIFADTGKITKKHLKGMAKTFCVRLMCIVIIFDENIKV